MGGSCVGSGVGAKSPVAAIAILLTLVTLAGLAGLSHAWVASASLGLMSAALGWCMYAEYALALRDWRRALNEYVRQDASRHMLAPKRSKIGACKQASALEERRLWRRNRIAP